MIRLLLLSALTLLACIASGEAANHAVAKVKKGENIEKLLQRYLLTPHNCNIETFRDINNIQKETQHCSGENLINYPC